MSITLYLLNRRGYKVLKSIVDCEKSRKLLDAVIASEDPQNQEDYYKEIKDLCKQNNIVFKGRKEIYKNESNYSLAVGWRWIIPDVPNLIVIHDSYLPYYRGFSPLVNMLIKGENYVAATAIIANERMDEGDIIIQKKIGISYPIKIQEAIDLVSDIYVDLVSEILKKINSYFTLQGIPQNHSKATYSIWRGPEDYFINWNRSASEIVRFVNAVGFPYGGARTRASKEVIKIVSCEEKEIKLELNNPGKIIMYEDGCPVVVCGRNAIKITAMEDLSGEPICLTKLRLRLF